MSVGYEEEQNTLGIPLFSSSTVTVEKDNEANSITLKAKENYSEYEEEIGTWIDGKPLYRKVIKLTSYEPTQDIDITELNFETIMIKDLLIKYKNDSTIWFRPRYTWGTNTNEFLEAYIIGKNLRFRYGNALLDVLNKTGNVFYYTIAILEYTKTTD